MSCSRNLLWFVFLLSIPFGFVIGDSPGEIEKQSQGNDGVARRFDAVNHTIMYKKYRQLPPTQLIGYIVNYLKEKYSGPLNLALDVGCGSGQSTLVLAEHFKQVLGTDISPNQIAQAKAANHHQNVRFEVSPAESTDLGNGSAQLITSGVAAHWFNLPLFFADAHRILSPGGAMALYSYGVAELKCAEDPSKNQKLNQIYKEEIFLSDRMNAHRRKEHVSWLNKYRDIVIPEPPFVDFLRLEDGFSSEETVNINYIFGHLQSSSTFQKLREKDGEEAALKYMEDGKKKLLAVLAPGLNATEDVMENTHLIYKNSFFLLLARKPIE